jgi:hypothetical protein
MRNLLLVTGAFTHAAFGSLSQKKWATKRAWACRSTLGKTGLNVLLHNALPGGERLAKAKIEKVIARKVPAKSINPARALPIHHRSDERTGKKNVA